MVELTGQLSNVDIEHECNKTESLQIREFDASHLKAASYDITPSIIAMSAKLGMLETVYREPSFPFRHYIVVSAKDSILAVSNEYLHLPSHIAGHVVSRVSKVIEGFGHISTSIDPGWSGALLIALSNPSSKPLKVYVGKSLYDNTSNNPLATVSFHYLNSEARVEKTNSYRGMRLDLLEKVYYKNKTGIRAWIQKLMHPRRRAFTDYFFEYCKTYAGKQNLENWEVFIHAFSGRSVKIEPIDQSEAAKSLSRKKTNPYEFVICETIWIRFAYWCKNRAYIFRWIAILAFVALVLSGKLENTVIEVITAILQIWA